MKIYIFAVSVFTFNFASTHLTTWQRYTEGDIAGVSPWLLYPGRSALVDKKYRWPNATVPYVFATGYPEKLIELFYLATEHISSRTCLKFSPRTNEQDYIKVVEGNGCYAIIGRRGEGEQNVSLPGNCGYLGTFVHELIHTIGFFHEHARSDRDNYVKIMWKNIIPGQEHNFERYSSRIVDSLGVEYDYDSVMHYRRDAFSMNGKDTIVTKPPGIPIGQLKGMSPKDVLKVNRMYNCTMQ